MLQLLADILYKNILNTNPEKRMPDRFGFRFNSCYIEMSPDVRHIEVSRFFRVGVNLDDISYKLNNPKLIIYNNVLTPNVLLKKTKN